jgi:hypothetical protein
MSLSTHPFEAFHPALHDHDGEICPMCEQAIPNDRLEQVKARQAQHQREVESQLALKLKAEREQLQQQNEQALAKAREEAAAKEAAARVEERRAATAAADVKIAAANNAAEAVRAQADALKKQLDASAAETNEKVTAARAEERRAASAEADAKVAAANTATDVVRAQADALKRQLDASAAETNAKVTAARAEERRAAAVEAETRVLAANTAEKTARAQADELKKQLAASAAATTEKVTAAREAARKEAEVALQPRLVAAQSAAQQAQDQARLVAGREEAARAQLKVLEEEKQAAVTAKVAAEQQVQALHEAHQKALRDGIQETREAMERSNRDALNAEQAKHFEDKQKIQNTVDDLKRQLENKTALELGEGAEVDLFEAIKEAFPDDDITRIKRGVAGADIRHMVRHNGKNCGLILYDSKNHKAWRSDFVTKLRDDQIADKADHAILSTIAFPQGTKQLHIQDGVVLVNPARAVVIAKLVRRQIVQAHCRNLSNDDREQKSLELYSFISSERFEALMTKLQATTNSLNELDVKEQAAHKAVWQKRGQLVGSVAKAQADLVSEIERIVGTAEDAIEEDLATMLTDIAATGAQ